jgi:predicted amidohydrolase
VKIAVYQGQSRQTCIDENLETMRQAAWHAADQQAQLIIFPEMFLTGYNIGEAVFKLAEPSDGSAAQKAAQIARETGIALLYGYPEQAKAGVYNSAIVVDRHGNTAANYRKTHLYGDFENRVFQKGDALVMAALEGLNIGILICYDIEFPEAARALTAAGSQLIAVPTALMEPYCRVAETVVATRAYENQIYVAYVNRCGSEDELAYCGSSCIVGPDGIDRVRAKRTEGLFVAQIDPRTVERERKQNPMLEQRRPAL